MRGGRGVVPVAVVTGLVIFASVAGAAPATGRHTTVGTKRGSGHSVLEAKGRYVYTHLTSSGNEVACNTSCLRIWPQVTSRRAPRAIDGVKQHKLGLTRHHHQVTYYGHRLYYFHYDTATFPFGKGITSFGGKWRLITVTGRAG
jgi:predicted lipoprotein with Yx(FWY)xxD motif